MRITQQEHERLVIKHDELVEEYNQTEDEKTLEQIGVLEMILAYSEMGLVEHPQPCDADDCLLCM